MLTSAMDIYNLAYAPYSGFKVSACILSHDNNIYSGVNVENSAFPEGMCAEASAISSMVSNGEQIIKEILIISDSDKLCAPCGGCRQKLNEFKNDDILIHLCNLKGKKETFLLSELLPLSFGPDYLRIS